MNRLLLSVAVPALLLSACATASGLNGAGEIVVSTDDSRPPHYPADLTPAGVRAADDHLALEEVNGAEAMAFVASENQKSLAALTGDRRYETFWAEAEAILTATDRIPMPSFLGDGVGNFWQDAANPKGVWRRTTLDSYRSADTQWTVLLDIDALSRAEGKDWVWKGADCLAPDETRCLISLSDGGKDAVVVREFDTTTGLWVEDGFILPEGKHRLEWLDRDTLLVATDFGEGTLTESGYPFIVKSLKRGRTLAEATEVYRGEQGDGGYGVSPRVFRDAQGRPTGTIITRPLDTFRAETYYLAALGVRPGRLALPARVSIFGMLGDRFILSPDEEWTHRGVTYPAGSLAALSAFDLEQASGIPDPSGPPPLIFTPAPRQSLQDVVVLSDSVVAVVSDNVVGTLTRFTPSRLSWRS